MYINVSILYRFYRYVCIYDSYTCVYIYTLYIYVCMYICMYINIYIGQFIATYFNLLNDPSPVREIPLMKPLSVQSLSP